MILLAGSCLCISASMLPLSFSPRTTMRHVRPRYAWAGVVVAPSEQGSRPGDHVFASRILPLPAHHDSRHAAALPLPRPTRRPQQYNASIESSRVAPCNRGCTTIMPIGADAEGHTNPLVESRVQSAGQRAHSFGCWVIHGPAGPRRTDGDRASSCGLVAFVLSVY